MSVSVGTFAEDDLELNFQPRLLISIHHKNLLLYPSEPCRVEIDLKKNNI